MYPSYSEKPYKSRATSPPISIYLLSSDGPDMDKISCIHCKRSIADIKGHIDKIISTPMPVIDFGVAVNILCKLCKQQYRVLVNSVAV